jgi:hypothetical protein
MPVRVDRKVGCHFAPERPGLYRAKRGFSALSHSHAGSGGSEPLHFRLEFKLRGFLLHSRGARPRIFFIHTLSAFPIIA